MAWGDFIFAESLFFTIVANKKVGVNNKKIRDRKYRILFIGIAFINQDNIYYPLNYTSL